MLLKNVTDATLARVMRNIDNIAPELSRYFANAHYERKAKTGFEVVIPSPANPSEVLRQNFYRISRREMREAEDAMYIRELELILNHHAGE